MAVDAVIGEASDNHRLHQAPSIIRCCFTFVKLYSGIPVCFTHIFALIHIFSIHKYPSQN